MWLDIIIMLYSHINIIRYLNITPERKKERMRERREKKRKNERERREKKRKNEREKKKRQNEREEKKRKRVQIKNNPIVNINISQINKHTASRSPTSSVCVW